MAASEHKDGPGGIWAVKEELPTEGLPNLANITPLYFSCNTAFRGTSREEFEVHVTALNSIHLRDLNTYAHEVA